jgi:triacylglycerol lipase
MTSDTLKTKHPIVLLHGLMGFERIGPFEYFRGVRKMLLTHGNTVHSWSQPNITTVERRARLILDRLRALENEGPFNLIGHSMGGLDARCLASSLRGGDFVASITTIGTPHHGSPAAHWRNAVLKGVGVMGSMQRRQTVWANGLLEHLEVFTREWSERFNEENPDVPHVRCRSWAGEVPAWRVSPIMQPLCPFLNRAEGPNDGVVSVKSARWCDEHFAGIIPADHLAQLGWKFGLNTFDKFKHLEFYRQVVQELVDAGL